MDNTVMQAQFDAATASRILQLVGVAAQSPLDETAAELVTWLTDRLLETRYAVAIDWRGYLSEFLEPIDRLAAECDFEFKFEEEDEDTARVCVAADDIRREVSVRFVPAEEDSSLDDVARQIAEIANGRIVIWRLADLQGTDTYGYALFPRAIWEELNMAIPQEAQHSLFVEL